MNNNDNNNNINNNISRERERDLFFILKRNGKYHRAYG